jgi:CubicO group peptidase (beta-lactamase class C family)
MRIHVRRVSHFPAECTCVFPPIHRRPALDRPVHFVILTRNEMRDPTSIATRDVVARFYAAQNRSITGAVMTIPPRPGFWRFYFPNICRLALLLLMALTLTACRTTADRQVYDAAPAIARLRAGGSLQAEVDTLVKPLVASGEVYGMVVGVVTPDGKTRTFGYGRTGRPGDPNPPDADSLFQIGSVSKLFVTTSLERLVEEGRLRYDDTVRGILPTNIPVSVEAGRLTLYQLATHTAGLPREPFNLTQLHSFLAYLVTGRNLYAHLTVPYLLGYLRDGHPQPKDPPEFFYSNFGAGLLAYLIEIKTGRPITNYIVQEICLPLGMSNSVFVLDAGQQNRLAVGHVGGQACWKSAGTPLAPWDMGDLMRPVAGMYSSANDLLRFARANLGLTDQPLAPALSATHRIQVKTPRGGEALGWIINRFDDGPQTITFKDGMVSGYCSYIGLDLDAHVAVVVLRNAFGWDDKVGHNLLRRLGGVYGARPEVAAGR